MTTIWKLLRINLDETLNTIKCTCVWEHILNHIKYEPNNTFSVVTSKQIKEAKDTWLGKQSQFEPRLLCKQDNKQKRPEIFKKYGVYLLSIKNGTYLLTKNNIYIDLPSCKSPLKNITIKNKSCLLTLGDSETTMIDNLRYNGVLEDIIGEKITYGPLLGGRHYCSFKTTLGNEELTITGSQYETDACYETNNHIYIIEAKNIETDNFNIRQLYYPFRSVYDKIGNKKKISCLFMYKDKSNIIHIYKYIWNNPLVMTDISCVDSFKYKLY